MRIAFRTDASVTIGTGHLSRCLTLAGNLRAQGWQTHFVCRDIAPAFVGQIHAQGHALTVLQTPAGAEANPDTLAHSPWLAVTQQADAGDTMAAWVHRAGVLLRFNLHNESYLQNSLASTTRVA